MQHKNILTCRAERQSSAKQKLFRHLFGIVGGSALLIGFGTTHAETFTLEEATIDQIQKAMADGALTSVELTSMYLNRIAIYDRSGIKLNAVSYVNPSVFDEASAADARAASSSDGPLNGIVYLPKENHAVKGFPLDLTLPAFANLGITATLDAENIVRMRRAGAVVIGLSRMEDYYLGAPDSGPAAVLNPYGLDLETGNSSSGSGAALASNFAVVSTGGDTGASNRVNSSFSALATMRYTWGAVSGRGIAPLRPGRDEPAPIARTSRDLARVMDVIAGEDPANTLAALRLPSYRQLGTSYTSEMKGQPLLGVRLGFFKDAEFDASVEPIKSLMQAAIADLRALGATVVEVAPLETFTQFRSRFRVTPPEDPNNFGYNVDADASYYHAFDSFFRTFTTSGLSLTSTFIGTYAQSNFTSVSNGGYLESYQILSGRPAGANIALDDDLVSSRQKVADDYAAYFAANDIDALIHPLFSQQATTKGTWLTYPGAIVQWYLYAPISGFPTADAFGGFDPATGIPSLGLEFLGLPYSDAKLLAYADAYERFTNHRRPPALTPPLPGETIEYSTALPPPSRPELAPPALRVAAGAKVAGKGKKATLVLTGGAVDASGLAALTVYVNGKKIAAKKAKNWKASVKLSTLRSFVKGSAKTVQVTVVAKDVYGNTSVTTKTVKLPKTV